MTESEREPEAEAEAPPAPAAQQAPSGGESPLNEAERAFLACLLHGGDWKAAGGRTMPSLLADAINEKLFDLFGDTVLAFDGDTPEPVEDYIEELKGIV